MQSEVLDDEDQLGHRAHGSDDAEHCQEEVPQGQRVAQLESLPRRHVALPAEDQDHVDADVVERRVPVLLHPFLAFHGGKVLFKLEKVRVIRNRHGHHIEGSHLGVGESPAEGPRRKSRAIHKSRSTEAGAGWQSVAPRPLSTSSQQSVIGIGASARSPAPAQRWAAQGRGAPLTSEVTDQSEAPVPAWCDGARTAQR